MDRIAVVLLAFGLWATMDTRSIAQNETGPSSSPWHYQLIEGSLLALECPNCDGPPLLQPLRGSFKIRLLEENPISARYALDDILWTTSVGLPGSYTATGSGIWQIGGEVALQQTMSLDLTVNGQQVQLTNSSALVPRPWPMIGVPLVESPPGSVQGIRITLNAAPFRELWFSTASGFTPSDFERPRGSSGDLLSSAGRVVRSNHELIDAFGFEPADEDQSIDAFEVAPGGEVIFSLNETRFSGSLGAIQHGDLIGESGQRLLLNQQLLEPFGLVFNALDLGLDAVTIREDGEILFSITTNITSPTIGPLSDGDLLSNRGVIFLSHSQLLSRFLPQEDVDFGLDAVYVWPHGEIWFSLEGGFTDRDLGPIQTGDILSDQGYIIVRNLDLLGPFQPIEDLADFGLDGLFVVTDFVPLHDPPVLHLPRSEGASVWRLEWSGSGRVVQFESATPSTLSWEEASPLIPGRQALLPSTDPALLIRLRQW